MENGSNNAKQDWNSSLKNVDYNYSIKKKPKINISDFVKKPEPSFPKTDFFAKDAAELNEQEDNSVNEYQGINTLERAKLLLLLFAKSFVSIAGLTFAIVLLLGIWYIDDSPKLIIASLFILGAFVWVLFRFITDDETLKLISNPKVRAVCVKSVYYCAVFLLSFLSLSGFAFIFSITWGYCEKQNMGGGEFVSFLYFIAFCAFIGVIINFIMNIRKRKNDYE